MENQQNTSTLRSSSNNHHYKNQKQLPTTPKHQNFHQLYKKAKWDEFTQEIENALQGTPPPTNVHIANAINTNQILLADKHHIPKGRFKKVNQPLPQHIIDIIKQRNALRNSNHLDPNIKTLNDKNHQGNI